jgi:deoxyribodipyrimidine photo-lyase
MAYTKSYKRSLFLFRRDLRISDNTALHAALQASDEVIVGFIINPMQVGAENPYRSIPAIQFMQQSLLDLQEQIRKSGGFLHLWYGEPVTLVKKLCAHCEIEALFINADYTPYSKVRDAKLEEVCTASKVVFHLFHDVLLLPPGTVVNKKGAPYKQFSAFYRAAQSLPIATPIKAPHTMPFIRRDEIPLYVIEDLIHSPHMLHSQGGSRVAERILHTIERWSDYSHTRDLPAQSTTGLSAHLKFGTISVRRVYWTLVKHFGVEHALVRQLFWRDFFTYIAFFFPHVFGHACNDTYDELVWSNNLTHFKAWCTGTTGFPIVDAGMRELVTTGYMHNRVRMITASFLVKDLHIDWRWGEQFFAQNLIDYDPAVNNGNWQWVASTGCDAQPFFRIMNPWLQQKKFDRQATYIKRWLPELSNIPVADVHTWYRVKKKRNGYPAPLVDHSIEARIARNLYKRKFL